MTLYVISTLSFDTSDDDETGHEPLRFWNNENGFGNLENATVFTEDEAQTFDLPIANDQPEWVALPSCLDKSNDQN